MAVSHEVVKESDGSYTIKHVEIAKAGLWKPANWGGKAWNLTDTHLVAMQHADSEIRENTSLQPVVRNQHEKEIIGGTHESRRIGILGPIRRIACSLFSDLRGLTEKVADFIMSGQAGTISPDIIFGYTLPNQTRLPIVLKGISFTGPAWSAISTLDPIAKFEAAFEDENNGEHIALAELIQAESSDDQMALFSAPTDQKEETGMSQEELGRLKEEARKEIFGELEAKKVAFEAEQQKQVAALEARETEARAARIKQFMVMAAPKIEPKRTEKILAFAQKLSDDALGDYFEDLMAGPDVALKSTDKATPTPSGDGPTIGQQIQEKVLAFQATEPTTDLKELYARAEKEVGQDEVRAWFHTDQPKETIAVEANRLEVVH